MDGWVGYLVIMTFKQTDNRLEEHQTPFFSFFNRKYLFLSFIIFYLIQSSEAYQAQ